MGRRELLEALRREGEQTMAAIAAKGAADEEELRNTAVTRREELRQEHEQQCARLCEERKRSLIAVALREAGLIRLRAEHAMALRLRRQADGCLARLCRDNRREFFAALAAELPNETWQTVRVSPGESAIAAVRFPGASVIADEAVSGGIAAATADSGLTVDNTLETRLERLWPELLPSVMAEVRRLAE